MADFDNQEDMIEEVDELDQFEEEEQDDSADESSASETDDESEYLEDEDEVDDEDEDSDEEEEPKNNYYKTLKDKNKELEQRLDQTLKLLEDPDALAKILAAKGQNINKEPEDPNAWLKDVVDDQGNVDITKFKAYVEKLARQIAKEEAKQTYKEGSIEERTSEEISLVFEEHPELDPNSEGYNKMLDDMVTSYWKGKGGPGKFSVRQAVKDVYKMMGNSMNEGKKKGEQEASKKARVQIKKKVVAGLNNNKIKEVPEDDEESLSAADKINLRLQKAFQAKRR